MPTKTKQDVVDLFQTFQKSVLDQKPSVQEMASDVRMMQFKVRPVQGDISELDFLNTQFLEALWSLGKLDEFYRKTVRKIKTADKTTFFSMFDHLYQQYQSKLNHINLKRAPVNEEKLSKGFEVEIFRETSKKLN